ncbi:uncharacterized protein LOC129584005 [Paramacrobiotus metropolitanus]|uniref:uncharacterized protein LOC129584005 n=1 Tax=Paramacrobiotus metropolitanus TaxID=2943436 RepID=UPI0024462581|nr:uncharacterized protein LOC129584005 [Paramacrobiotus metropolitanus]XP_055332060.1 uncharacterized protein LOC129584005 [Paramacrobiotus metropolitanus]
MNYEKIDLDSVGLVSYDFAPRCIQPDSLLHWPVFDHFHTVLESANTFLSINPGVHAVACETLHLRVEKDHIRDPDRSDYFQTGEILRPFVKGLRVWVQKRPENLRSPIPDQINYINFVPNIAKTEAADKNPMEIITEMNDWIKEHRIPGRIISIDTLQMRGVEGEVNVDITSWKQDSAAHVKQSFLNFFRIFYVIDASYPVEEIGFMDFLPETLEGVGIFSWPIVERLPEVVDHVSQWAKRLPPNVRLLNFQTILCRSDYKMCLDPYKTYYWDEYFHVYHRRLLRIGYALTTEKSLPVVPVANMVTTVLFAPGIVRDPHWYKWSGAYETQSTVKERMNAWIKLTQASVVGVETLAYKASTGAECSEGFNAMHTWNEKGRHGAKQEQYLICLRVYINGAPDEPKDFLWPKTLLDWEKENPSSNCKFC